MNQNQITNIQNKPNNDLSRKVVLFFYHNPTPKCKKSNIEFRGRVLTVKSTNFLHVCKFIPSEFMSLKTVTSTCMIVPITFQHESENNKDN